MPLTRVELGEEIDWVWDGSASLASPVDVAVVAVAVGVIVVGTR